MSVVPGINADTHGTEPSAAILVIGDEVLSARVTDVNSVYLCRRLDELGVAVGRVVVVPDVVAQIAADVAELSASFTHVITTGGVGPTHDDVTMAGVAAAFDMPLVRHPVAERAIRDFYGADMADAALRMADLPKGAELVLEADMRFPVVHVGNVWIFPGSPHLLKMKFERVSDRFASTPYHTERLALNTGEPEIAPFLSQVQDRFADVAIGSYPQEPGEPVRLIITLKGKNADRVAAVLAALKEGLEAYRYPEDAAGSV